MAKSEPPSTDSPYRTIIFVCSYQSNLNSLDTPQYKLTIRHLVRTCLVINGTATWIRQRRNIFVVTGGGESAQTSVKYLRSTLINSYSTTNKIGGAPVSQIIYSCKTLYMFRTVLPSIIRSSKLHIRQQAYVRQLVVPAASSSFELLMMDGKTVRNM